MYINEIYVYNLHIHNKKYKIAHQHPINIMNFFRYCIIPKEI